MDFLDTDYQFKVSYLKNGVLAPFEIWQVQIIKGKSIRQAKNEIIEYLSKNGSRDIYVKYIGRCETVYF